jgi:predicted helicase
MTNLLPSIHFGEVAGSQCFPLYVFGKDEADEGTGGLFAGDATTNGGGRRDGITNAGLEHVRSAYPGEVITKEDIFFYVYGLLHSEDYRERYSENLTKELPRIPRVKGADVFRKFVESGRRLSDLHVNYEQADPYSLQIKEGDLRLANIGDPVSYFRVEKMKFAGKRGAIDKSTVVFNPRITLTGIPLEAYDYVVNGKSALEWVMERQCVKTDPASGIVNDANLYAKETVGDPMYPLLLFQRMITVSLETMKIVRSLPPLGELS